MLLCTHKLSCDVIVRILLYSHDPCISEFHVNRNMTKVRISGKTSKPFPTKLRGKQYYNIYLKPIFRFNTRLGIRFVLMMEYVYNSFRLASS